MLAEFFLLGVIGNAAYVGLLVLAGAGLLRAYAGSREFGAFSVLFLALYLAQIMLAHGDPRYHAPLIPIFAIWAGAPFWKVECLHQTIAPERAPNVAQACSDGLRVRGTLRELAVVD